MEKNAKNFIDKKISFQTIKKIKESNSFQSFLKNNDDLISLTKKEAREVYHYYKGKKGEANSSTGIENNKQLKEFVKEKTGVDLTGEQTRDLANSIRKGRQSNVGKGNTQLSNLTGRLGAIGKRILREDNNAKPMKVSHGRKKTVNGQPTANFTDATPTKKFVGTSEKTFRSGTREQFPTTMHELQLFINGIAKTKMSKQERTNEVCNALKACDFDVKILFEGKLGKNFRNKLNQMGVALNEADWRFLQGGNTSKKAYEREARVKAIIDRYESEVKNLLNLIEDKNKLQNKINKSKSFRKYDKTNALLRNIREIAKNSSYLPKGEDGFRKSTFKMREDADTKKLSQAQKIWNKIVTKEYKSKGSLDDFISDVISYTNPKNKFNNKTVQNINVGGTQSIEKIKNKILDCQSRIADIKSNKTLKKGLTKFGLKLPSVKDIAKSLGKNSLKSAGKKALVGAVGAGLFLGGMGKVEATTRAVLAPTKLNAGEQELLDKMNPKDASKRKAKEKRDKEINSKNKGTAGLKKQYNKVYQAAATGGHKGMMHAIGNEIKYNANEFKKACEQNHTKTDKQKTKSQAGTWVGRTKRELQNWKQNLAKKFDRK